jgi:hypothetical protein
MLFLNRDVWPIAMRDGVLQHDAFTCVEFDDALGFPVALDRKGFHVGQVFDAEGKGRKVDINLLLKAMQPEACKPGGDPAKARGSSAQIAPENECAQLQHQHHVPVSRSARSPRAHHTTVSKGHTSCALIPPGARCLRRCSCAGSGSRATAACLLSRRYSESHPSVVMLMERPLKYYGVGGLTRKKSYRPTRQYARRDWRGVSRAA